MTCAKQTVVCSLITPEGEIFTGTNGCRTPQPECPRGPGEGYAKCTTVCGQRGHAEVEALRVAGDRARGSRAFVAGHTYACRECQEMLFGAGVISLSVLG